MAQTLARHSTINLTMNTYTKLGVSDQAAAVEALPPVPAKKPEAATETLRATGTDGGAAASSGPKKGADSGAEGAENGAVRLAPYAYQIASVCTEADDATCDDVAGFGEKPREKQSRPGRIRTSDQGIMSPEPGSRNEKTHQDLRQTETAGVPTMVPNDPAASSTPQIPPDLARAIRVWDRLPKSTKKRIMTIIDCANKRR